MADRPLAARPARRRRARGAASDWRVAGACDCLPWPAVTALGARCNCPKRRDPGSWSRSRLPLQPAARAPAPPAPAPAPTHTHLRLPRTQSQSSDPRRALHLHPHPLHTHALHIAIAHGQFALLHRPSPATETTLCTLARLHARPRLFLFAVALVRRRRRRRRRRLRRLPTHCHRRTPPPPSPPPCCAGLATWLSHVPRALLTADCVCVCVTVSASPGTASTAVAQQPTDCATTDRTCTHVRMYVHTYIHTHMPAHPSPPDSCGPRNPLPAYPIVRVPSPPALSPWPIVSRAISPDLCMRHIWC